MGPTLRSDIRDPLPLPAHPAAHAGPGRPAAVGRRRGWRAVLGSLTAVVLAAGGAVACGDDGGERSTEPTRSTPTGPVGDAEILALAGGAPAASGAGLGEPPGPADRDLLEGFGEVAIAIRAPDGTVTGWCVLVAAAPHQRRQGLMEVTDLEGYAGMVFVYAEDDVGGFHMRSTPMPLSIAWFDADGELVSTADMTPCLRRAWCRSYRPGERYRFALEVPQGDLPRLGVTAGSRLAIGGECAA
ncbi:MAG TPA: DUF192 domain-containing protein [Acidimicrobiales bacterium]